MDKTPAELYREREQRVSDAIQLKIPDRVPLEISFGYFPAKYAGITCEAAYYDYDAWLAACKKTLTHFGEDISRVQPFFPGRVLEMLDIKPMTWPGHGSSPQHSHQYIEMENMRADEYDALLQDPTDFALRHYLPRVAGSVEPFGRLPAISSPSFGYRGAIALSEAFSNPEVALAISRLQAAGEELRRWKPKMDAFAQEFVKMGFPPYTVAYGLAPFDAISDHLRGMKGTMLDMYRQPDNLLAACEAVLQRMLATIAPAQPGAQRRVGIPLHRGAEGFMSLKQFEKFYWPTLKRLIIALVDKGYYPCVAFEGDYTSRLEYLLELPRGKVLGHFDVIDLCRTKDVLRGHMAISGNVPVSLLQTGTPPDVKDYCRKLIDYVGKDGGYIMSTRSPVDDAKPENLKTLISFTVEYGIYS